MSPSGTVWKAKLLLTFPFTFFSGMLQPSPAKSSGGVRRRSGIRAPFLGSIEVPHAQVGLVADVGSSAGSRRLQFF